uniref:Uncharacterized protein n=1 Tax=Ditylenchus dipsaci TaxID=166011 RepID=A0A915DRZ4_9BILA
MSTQQYVVATPVKLAIYATGILVGGAAIGYYVGLKLADKRYFAAAGKAPSFPCAMEATMSTTSALKTMLAIDHQQQQDCLIIARPSRFTHLH